MITDRSTEVGPYEIELQPDSGTFMLKQRWRAASFTVFFRFHFFVVAVHVRQSYKKNNVRLKTDT